MVLNSIISSQSSSSGVFPALVLVQGNEQKSIVLNRTPFSVGRKVDKDLVIADPRVSRAIRMKGAAPFTCRPGWRSMSFAAKAAIALTVSATSGGLPGMPRTPSVPKRRSLTWRS